MHRTAYEFVRRHGSGETGLGLDIGGRSVNGTGRAHWPNVTWSVVDITDGDDVELVADATDPAWLDAQGWKGRFDVVLCTEVLEHVKNWQGIVESAAAALAHNGLLVITCAGPGRAPHRALDGELLDDDSEHYANVSTSELGWALIEAGLVLIELRSSDGVTACEGPTADTYAVAKRC